MSKRNRLRQIINAALSEMCISSRSGALPYSIETLERRTMLNAGGGYVTYTVPTGAPDAGVSGNGIFGEYFASTNGTINTTPSFERYDVRIDFANNTNGTYSGTSEAPGGGLPTDPTYGAITTASTWSVIWDGTVIPKYTETYTMKEIIGSGDTGAVQWGTGTEGNNPTIMTGTGTQTTTVSMIAGQSYNLEMTYVHKGGSTWQAQLHWSSSGSNPFAEEAIEPATTVGADTSQVDPADFANGALGAAYSGNLTISAAASITGTLTSGSTTITNASEASGGLAGVAEGEYVAGTGIVGGSTITAVNTFNQSITISTASTYTGVATNISAFGGPAPAAINGTLTSGSTTITGAGEPGLGMTGVAVGQYIDVAGVPAGATITAFNSSTIVLSTASTYTGVDANIVADAGPPLNANGDGWPTGNFALSQFGDSEDQGISEITFAGAATLYADGSATTGVGGPDDFLLGNNNGVGDITGYVTNNSSTITGVSEQIGSTTATVVPGESVTGMGLPTGATVVASSGTYNGNYAITLSTTATSTHSNEPLSLFFQIGSNPYYNYGNTLSTSVLTYSTATGTGYNTISNTTTVLDYTGTSGWQNVGFTNTSQNGYGAPNNTQTSSSGGGVSNLQILMPTEPNPSLSAVQFYPSGSVLSTPFLQEQAPYTALRVVEWNTTWYAEDPIGSVAVAPATYTDWSDTPDPNGIWVTNPNAKVAYDALSQNEVPWEDVIMLANQTGKDLYINLPGTASGQASDTGATLSSSYIYQLAELLKNGTTVDGVVYPGLLPNLSVYIEYGNENWNGLPGAQADIYNYDMTLAKAADSTDWQEYVAMGGGTTGSGFTGGVELWTVLRDYDISAIFRGVYGNAVMPSSANGSPNADPRIRPVYEWQYGGAFNDGMQDSATYLADVDTNFGVNANYYLYGGGGGWYADDLDNASSATQLFADAPTIMDTPYGVSLTQFGSSAKGLNLTTDIESDDSICQQFGLKDVGYEGGFDFGGGDADSADRTASLETQVQPLVQESLDEFYQAGGAMPFVFQNQDIYRDIDGDPQGWGVINNLWDQTGPGGTTAGYLSADPPKLQEYVNSEQALPPTPLPAGWTGNVIGAISTGSSTVAGNFGVGSGYADGTGDWTILGSNPGNTGVSASGHIADQGYYASTAVSGNVTLSAELVDCADGSNWAATGLMMRTSATDPSAPYVALLEDGYGNDGNGGFVMADRLSESATTTSSINFTSSIPAPGPLGENPPVWMELVESVSGAYDYFTGYISSNDVTWTKIATVSITSTSFSTSSFSAGLANDSNGNSSTIDTDGPTGPFTYNVFQNVNVSSGIISDSFAGTTSNPTTNGENVNGLSPNLADLPGATYTSSTQNTSFNSGAQITTSVGNSAPAVDTEYNTSVSIPLSDSAFTAPSVINISADTEMNTIGNNNDDLRGIGLGFYPTAPANNTDSSTGFSGLLIYPNGQLELVVNGADVGSAAAAPTGWSATSFYNLSYSVNTATGQIFNVVFDNQNYSAYFTSTTAFTGAAVNRAGFYGSSGVSTSTYGYVDNFNIARASQPTPIIYDSFAGTTSDPTTNGENVTGLSPNLANLPGTTYTSSTQNTSYNSGAQITTSAGNPAPAVDTEFNTSVSIPLSGNSYAPPSILNISADAEMNTLGNNGSGLRGIGLGFYPTAPANNTDSSTGFTGVLITPSGQLQLVVNGADVGSAAAAPSGWSATQFYNLSYSVNTATGQIFNVIYDGQNYSSDFTSTAFTGTAVNRAGFYGSSGTTISTYGYVDDFEVAGLIPN